MEMSSASSRVIDCGDCVMAHTSACDDSIVSHIIDGPRLGEFSADEMSALTSLTKAGLVPRLRLVANV